MADLHAQEPTGNIWPQMALVPAGGFGMGDPFEEAGMPGYYVTVDSLHLSSTELSFVQFDAFCAATGRKKPDDNGWGRGQMPVINVSWYDAVEYCNWLSVQACLQPCYQIDKQGPSVGRTDDPAAPSWIVRCNWDATGFRLPTESEWVYAASEGGKLRRFGNGTNRLDPAACNFNAQVKTAFSIPGIYRMQTVPCGSLGEPNALGLFDMSGNVREWCWDWYARYVDWQTPELNIAYGPPQGQKKCVMGGAWKEGPGACRAVSRFDLPPGHGDYGTGFRIALRAYGNSPVQTGWHAFFAHDYATAKTRWEEALQLPGAAAGLKNLIVLAEYCQKDDQYWEHAHQSLAGCKAYIDAFSNGNHLAEAQRGLYLFSDDDGDGVQNADDNCPQQKGALAHHGCPVSAHWLNVSPETLKARNLIVAPGGTFEMGHPRKGGEPDEQPIHTVQVDSFYISVTEITFDQFDAFCAVSGRDKPDDKGWGRGQRPVINVDWYDAVEYCNWRSQMEHLQPCYQINKIDQDYNNFSGADPKKWIVTCDWYADGYRLPTEAEWEYAARAGGIHNTFADSGDTLNAQFINVNSSQTTAVAGAKPVLTAPCRTLAAPNAWGLYDMSLNVWEWCWDWYNTGAYAKCKGETTNPKGPGKGQFRCVRGGGWQGNTTRSRACYRYQQQPEIRKDNTGFRVVRH